MPTSRSVTNPRNQPSSLREMGEDGGDEEVASWTGAVVIINGNERAISFSNSKYKRRRSLCEISNAFDFRVGDINGDVRGRCNDKCCVSSLVPVTLNSVSNCGDKAQIEF